MPTPAIKPALALLCSFFVCFLSSGCDTTSSRLKLSSDASITAVSSVPAFSLPSSAELADRLPVTLSFEGQSYTLLPDCVKVNAQQEQSFQYTNPPQTFITTKKPVFTLDCPKDTIGELVVRNEQGALAFSTDIKSDSLTFSLPEEAGLYSIHLYIVSQADYPYWQQFVFNIQYKPPSISSAAVVSASDSAADKPQIELSANTISPGDIIAVKIKGYDGSKLLYAKFANASDRTFPLYKKGDEYLGFAAITSMTTKPGKLQIYASENGKSGGVLLASVSMNVGTKTFKRQDLTVVSGSKMAEAGSEENLESDKAIIAKVTANPSPELYCEDSFIQPVQGRISTQYGQRRYTNGVFTSAHSGLDIAAAEGTPVSAAGGAKVVFAGEMKFYGNTVILDHGLGLFSFYNHMSVICVEEGQMVAKGDKIGEVGTTGYSTGPHLHWNIRLFETNVDPALFTKENSIISDMKRMMSE